MAFADHVFPHGPLEPLADGLWQVQGRLRRGPLPRNIVVYRLPDGALWLHSVVALESSAMADLDALGPVRFVVVPSGLHRTDPPAYAERYPEAAVVCADEVRDKVADVVRVDSVVEAALSETDIVVHQPPGIVAGERVFELPIDGGVALVFCDSLFNLGHQPGIGGWSLRLLGSSGFFGVTRIGRWLSPDLAAWKTWLLEQAERNDVHVISVAHGSAITEDCAGRLRQAAERL